MSKQKERPILMSAPMVRAILSGAKTQTRRIVKPQPRIYEVWLTKCCPCGEPGERLWVRETFAPDKLLRPGEQMEHGEPVVYKADDDLLNNEDQYVGRWIPSIHMPRWACRLTLEVTNVRVERLQDISEEDAKAEGCEQDLSCHDANGGPCYTLPFQKLWTSIHGIDNPNSWESNPWVWAISFQQTGDSP